MTSKRKIQAKVFSFMDSYIELENLVAIKVKSSKYNIMIMEDYLPVIGEVDGSVSFVFENGTKDLNGIEGFYMHRNNEFKLLIKGSKNDR